MALPPSTDFTGAGVTEGGFKTAITSLRDFLSGLFGTTGTQATALSTLGVPFNATSAKTSAYTVVAADRGKNIDCTTGTFTVTGTAAATLGDGFVFTLTNSGAGVITFDPNGAETVDGASTDTVAAGESKTYYCNGTLWRSVAMKKTTVTSVNGSTGAVTTGSAQLFTTAGTSSFTVPASGRVLVTCCGGGGAGDAAGYAGTAGVSVTRWITGLTPGASITVTVGAGKAYNNAGTGGTSSFGSYVSATGGVTSAQGLYVNGQDSTMHGQTVYGSGGIYPSGPQNGTMGGGGCNGGAGGKGGDGFVYVSWDQ